MCLHRRSSLQLWRKRRSLKRKGKGRKTTMWKHLLSRDPLWTDSRNGRPSENQRMEWPFDFSWRACSHSFLFSHSRLYNMPLVRARTVHCCPCRHGSYECKSSTSSTRSTVESKATKSLVLSCCKNVCINMAWRVDEHTQLLPFSQDGRQMCYLYCITGNIISFVFLRTLCFRCRLIKWFSRSSDFFLIV